MTNQKSLAFCGLGAVIAGFVALLGARYGHPVFGMTWGMLIAAATGWLSHGVYWCIWKDESVFEDEELGLLAPYVGGFGIVMCFAVAFTAILTSTRVGFPLFEANPTIGFGDFWGVVAVIALSASTAFGITYTVLVVSWHRIPSVLIMMASMGPALIPATTLIGVVALALATGVLAMFLLGGYRKVWRVQL